MARRAFSFRITLAQAGLANDRDFMNASAVVQAEVLRWLVVLGLKEKDKDLSEGLDRYGNDLAPISAATRKHRESAMGPADPDAPPLMPAYAVSRTRLLLTGEPFKGGAEFWWEIDSNTGVSWGQILAYHRAGIGRFHRTKRDVIGISPDALARVRAEILIRWEAYKRNTTTPPKRVPPIPAIPPRQQPPVRIQLRGRTDIEHFTFGIGGGGRVSTEAAIHRGHSTGFFQTRPGGGGTAYGGPPARGFLPPGGGIGPRPQPLPPAPAPAPAGIAPLSPKDAVNLTEQQLGVTFTPHDGNNLVTVVIDLRKAHADLMADIGYAVGPGGLGGIPGRYANFIQFLANARTDGTPIEQPRVTIDDNGIMTITDGRHRVAALYDQGVVYLPVSVPKSEAKALQARYGVD